MSRPRRSTAPWMPRWLGVCKNWPRSEASHSTPSLISGSRRTCRSERHNVRDSLLLIVSRDRGRFRCNQNSQRIDEIFRGHNHSGGFCGSEFEHILIVAF